MRVLTDCLEELSEYGSIQRELTRGKTIAINGLVDSQKLHMMYGLSKQYPVRIIITHSDLRAKEISEEYRFYDKETIYFPGKDFIFFQADIHGNKLTRERICAYRRMLEGLPVTIVTTFDSIMAPCIPLHVLEENRIFVDGSSHIEESALAAQLVKMGYEKCGQVESGGQFSIRGGIIDVFDFTEENPYRIELWGDEVESLRSFDVLSQRSIEELDSIVIYPATEFILSKQEKMQGLALISQEAEKTAEILRKQFKTEEAARVMKIAQGLKEQLLEFGSMANLESYIRYFYREVVSFLDLLAGRNTVLFLDEPARIKEHGEAVELEFRESMMHRIEKGYALPGQGELLFSQGEVLNKMKRFPIGAFALLESRGGLLEADNSYHMLGKSINSFQSSFEALVKELEGFKRKGYRVLLASASRTRAKRLAEDLMEEGLSAFYSEDMDKKLEAGQVMVFYGNLKRGFEYPLIQFAVLSESDIFGEKKKKKKKKKRYEGEKIHDFTELKVGDYVVHENHGLGIYKGIEKVEVDKVVKDYMKIEYRDGGNLYVLATGFNVIQKYASADARKPKLNKLGTKEWEKTKTKVKTATMEVAKDLVQLYAARQEKKGYVFSKDTLWQKEFEELFPYEETEDQLMAIEDTKKDMESAKIMDRLICGDVGYGKTEIAIRAAFKAVQEGKQVVYLVPTTILAQQHYDTFVQRMKNYPITIELLSRFRTSAQQKKAVEGLKKGMVDIVIGTHRVLSKDVSYKDLGLLIIDEEQRFGVTHKEKIKQMKDSIDVLTLTATPIPRTLHMSLVGIRDMSVLEEPPNDRMPIQTYVMEYNEEMVREAIVRELARQGQVYYVYNRVNQIDEVAMKLQALVPEANVAFAHGQMKERELEAIMYDFINGDIDVLVSTTIIETGLDIPNVNTMIIHDSDNLGLSQLYQLRGRVGRSNRNAYAFLMYRRDKMLKEVAEKRLQAIREFTDLGSGFKIAMKDLEIRGAGNLLGARQHGHMEAVGYDLYCKMLNEAVKSLKGQKEAVDFTTTIDMDVDAYIPQEYIVNEFQKLDIYKRIAAIENQEESEEMKEELLDRFGAVPDSVENLLRISLIRVRAHKIYGTELKGKKDRLVLTVHEHAPLLVEQIPRILEKYDGRLLFSPKGVPVFTYKLYPTGFLKKDEEALLQAAEELLEDMEKELL
ncbi:MAG: transcription-repair coupling factor [Lachnospiraceae bacterium]|nr:transcription-repair coupling factor [Lachnospiraceae bacterium]